MPVVPTTPAGYVRTQVLVAENLPMSAAAVVVLKDNRDQQVLLDNTRVCDVHEPPLTAVTAVSDCAWIGPFFRFAMFLFQIEPQL